MDFRAHVRDKMFAQTSVFYKIETVANPLEGWLESGISYHDALFHKDACILEIKYKILNN